MALPKKAQSVKSATKLKANEVAKVSKMSKIAQKMMDKAYAPYSNFHVGACVEANGGSLFGGCNVENASYGVTLCAECTAISSLVAAGKKRIKSILIMGSGDGICPPCGRCRQLIREFAALNTPIYLCDKKGKLQETVTLEQLLPMSFGPDNLGK